MTGSDGMPIPGSCDNSYTAPMFKFNLDPAGDSTGLRNWGAANSIQLAEVALFDETGAMIQSQATATNPDGNNPGGEPPSAAADGSFPDVACSANCNHKWLDFNKGDLVITFTSPMTVVQYDWMTANDAPARDPAKWTLESSDDGTAWTVIEDSNAVNAFTPTSERYAWQGPWCVTTANVVSGATSATFSQFKFNLDPAGDSTGLRSWSGANSIQLSEIALYDAAGTYVPDATCTNPGGNNPGNEPPSNAYNQIASPNPKWLDFNKGDLVMTFAAPVTVATYDWMTANDAPARDPTKWSLEGSNDGSTWAVVDDTYATTALDTPGGRYTWVGPFDLTSDGTGR